MGYKSRADENSWNGASRKVLDNELATHLAMYQSIPDIYTRVEKLGVCLCLFVCVCVCVCVAFFFLLCVLLSYLPLSSLPAFDLQGCAKCSGLASLNFCLVETCLGFCWIMRQKSSSMLVVTLWMMFLTLVFSRQRHLISKAFLKMGVS